MEKPRKLALLLDLTGHRYGMLTVIALDSPSKCGTTYWLCRCDCGNTRSMQSLWLRRAKLASCGCQRAVRKQKHGCSRTREYRIWQGMIQRCENPKQNHYQQYGGRGITVHPDWRGSFENFLRDLGAAPPKATIDRIDNNGNYAPGNCRWATRHEQAFNRRSNRILEFNGRRQTIAEWAIELNIKQVTISTRLSRGWSTERALTLKPQLKTRTVQEMHKSDATR